MKLSPETAAGLADLLDEGEALLAAAPADAGPGTTEDVDVGDELRNLPGTLVGITNPGEALRRLTWAEP